MSIDANDLRSLSVVEKLRLVEMLWDDLGASPAPLPLPEWVDREATRRRDEMRDPSFGLSHEEAWRRIDSRNG
jgi:putative addiction module component (TIGR02574 family)